MIVPQFWAEGRVRSRSGNRQITIRRFGWSDESQAAAQAHADARAADALARAISGEKLNRREPKVPYHGTDGTPIREEIVSRHRDCVITRNSYGAKCLNTPNVFFADIDFAERAKPMGCLGWLVSLAISAAVAYFVTPDWRVRALLFLALIVSPMAWRGLLARITTAFRGGKEAIAHARVRQFAEQHPEWNLQLYRTPAGLRVMALHRTFEPNDPLVTFAFDELGVDPIYADMCLAQHCFRARVSPKPWRIGIENHLRPRPGVWPVSAERMPERNAWIANYDAQSRGYASCKFVEALGSGVINPDAKFVQELHDDFSQARRELPLG